MVSISPHSELSNRLFSPAFAGLFCLSKWPQDNLKITQDRMEPHINSHTEFTRKIDKHSRTNGLHDFDSHTENKHHVHY